MSAEIRKGPGKYFVTYRDDEDEVRIGISAAKTAEGTVAYDVMLKDATQNSRGQPVSLMLREKIRRALKNLPNPLDGPMTVY